MKLRYKEITNKIVANASRLTAGLLSALMILSFPGLCGGYAYAAAPTVQVDEAAYVNLDYYGAVSDISVVKSCSLNGITKFQDYGKYETVTNMSGYEKPDITADGVSWVLKKSTDLERFYYNCTIKKDALTLPWSIDVSYKLNGVPVKAETLAGASGLVEIDIHVVPNDDAKEYYKNNMILQAATYINTEDAYSIDAPGAQLQSIGTYKAAVFAAMPGEEAHFVIRIGSDSFETGGITMMMIPGTLQQLEDIKSLKEAKDTIGDSADAIFSSMDSILNTMDSMKTGIAGLKESTEEMEDARNTFSAGKDEMNQDADHALKDMTTIDLRLKSLASDFRDGQDRIKDLNDDIDSMIATLDQLKDPLSATNGSIASAQKDLKKLQSLLTMLHGQMGETLKDLWTVAESGTSGATEYDIAQLQGLTKTVSGLPYVSGTVGSLLNETIDMGNTTVEIVNISEDLIKEFDDLNGTLGDCEDQTVEFLEDCENFANEMSDSIESTVTYLTYTKSLLQESGDKLDAATEQSLKSMTDLLEKSLEGLKSVSTLRSANHTIKTTIDKEFDKIEKETSFINMDPDAEFVSFTSDKNPVPKSIQVILKTQEITLDDASDPAVDLETSEENVGLWGRIQALFQKILETFA